MNGERLSKGNNNFSYDKNEITSLTYSLTYTHSYGRLFGILCRIYAYLNTLNMNIYEIGNYLRPAPKRQKKNFTKTKNLKDRIHR